jgi:hypothetical protein
MGARDFSPSWVSISGGSYFSRTSSDVLSWFEVLGVASGCVL